MKNEPRVACSVIIIQPMTDASSICPISDTNMHNVDDSYGNFHITSFNACIFVGI